MADFLEEKVMTAELRLSDGSRTLYTVLGEWVQALAGAGLALLVIRKVPPPETPDARRQTPDLNRTTQVGTPSAPCLKPRASSLGPEPMTPARPAT